MNGKTNKKTVLVIDDDSDVLDVVSSFLKQANFNVVTCYDPMDIESSLNSNDINAVVCDYNMPKRNGYDCLKVIRDIKGNDFPIIMITGKKHEIKDKDKLNIKDFDAIYEKPINFKKLISSLNRELTEFKILNPKDFISIQLEGICMQVGADDKKSEFNVIEFVDDNTLWLEFPKDSFIQQKYYSFHIRCTNNDSIIDLQFQGKVEEITPSDEDKSIVLVTPKTLDTAIMDKLKGVFVERQNNITDFLKNAKGY